MTNDELLLDMIEKLHNKLEKVSDNVTQIQIEQVRQAEMHRINTLDLQEHMSRTETSEKRLEILEGYIDFVITAFKVLSIIGSTILFAVKVIPAILQLLSR